MGSEKGAFAIFVAILLAVVFCYPHQVFFVLRFLWQILVLNLQPVIQAILKYLPFNK